jgi:hypothetical protein
VTLDLIVLGLAVALEPLPVSGYLLLLGSERGLRKGWAFLAGWLLTLVAVVALTLALTGGEPLRTGSAPSTSMLVVKIVVGVGLLAFAWRSHRQPTRPRTTPRWMSRVDRSGPGAAAGLAFLLQPWGLVAAGAATITRADASRAATFAVLAAFCLLGTSSYLGLQVYAVRRPDAARQRLNGLLGWIGEHQGQLAMALAAAVGLWLVLNGLYLLVA